MTLAYFCNVTFKGKFWKKKTILETIACSYSDVAVHSHTFLNALRRQIAYVTLTFAKKVKTPWPTFRFYSSMPTTLPRTFLFGRMETCEGAATCSHCIWPTLAYICDCDTQLYDRSKIIHISNGITTTVKPPSKLDTLRCCRQLNVFVHKWLWTCESRWKWLDLIFGFLFWDAYKFTLICLTE